MAYGIKEQECRLDLSKKHTGKCYQHLPIRNNLIEVFKPTKKFIF